MAIKSFNPTSPARRKMTVIRDESLTKKRPEKSLTKPLNKMAGRNNQGKMTMRNRGGGHKRLYRIVDFKRNKDGIKAEVIALEYDPNRSANIALIQYTDGQKSYILAPTGLKVGDQVVTAPFNAINKTLKDSMMVKVVTEEELFKVKSPRSTSQSAKNIVAVPTILTAPGLTAAANNATSGQSTMKLDVI